jgi:MFS family permease
LGLFGALQSAGQTTAPLIAGLVAVASWRYAFLASAVVAGVLALVGLPATVSRRPAGRTALRAAYTLPVLRTGLAGFVGWGCLGGLAFLVSFRAGDALGLAAGGRGVLLTAFGVAGILSARPVGNLVDRWGGPRSVAVGMLTGGALLAGVGVVPSAVVAGALWALAGVASQFVLVGVNSLALSGPGDRGGVVSVVQACRFLGAAATPVVFTPTYHASPLASFLVPVGLLFAGAPAALAGRRSERDAEQGVHGST